MYDSGDEKGDERRFCQQRRGDADKTSSRASSAPLEHSSDAQEGRAPRISPQSFERQPRVQFAQELEVIERVESQHSDSSSSSSTSQAESASPPRSVAGSRVPNVSSVTAQAGPSRSEGPRQHSELWKNLNRAAGQDLDRKYPRANSSTRGTRGGRRR